MHALPRDRAIAGGWLAIWALLTLPVAAASTESALASPQTPATSEASDPRGVPAADRTDVPPAPIEAVWKTQKLEFLYQSFRTFYSCSSLEFKIKHILIALGADRDTQVRVTGCDFGSPIARMPVARITTSTPVEATAAALAELAKTHPQRVLAARVKNEPGERAELDQPFPARWEKVSLSRGSMGIEPGDCELIEQLNRRLLPKLSVRVLDSDFGCSNLQSLSRPRLEVEVLTQLPKADAAESVQSPKIR